jgi:outer membrane protein TolC
MIWPRIIFTGLLLSQSANAAMTLNEYLNQVRSQNQSFESATRRAEGAGLLIREADLFFKPQLFANATLSDDAKLPTTAGLTYDTLKVDNYNLGVEQNFSFGLETKLSYELTKTNLEGANLGGAATSYWDVGPKLELTMPLLKNGFGRTARANKTATLSQSEADLYSSSAQAESLLLNAEMTYWRLSAAQEQLRIQEQALAAGKNILSYVNGKLGRNLGERADVLQADALVQSYSLQLQQAQNELKQAERAFNTFLNNQNTAQTPVLETFNYKNLENFVIPQGRPGDRPDVKAAQAQARASRAASELAAERNRPQLDVFASYKANGRGDEQRDAIRDVTEADRDTKVVGVRFKVPLYMTAANDTIRGARLQQSAAEKNESYLRYQQEQDWTDLVQKISETSQSLSLSVKMENAQKAKLENERARLRQGRTTTYQVLLFEQDYSQAQAARIRTATQLLGLQSQIKLYQSQIAQNAESEK